MHHEFMQVLVNGKQSAEIDDSVVLGALNLYPEEKLRERSVFESAFNSGKVEYQELKDESEKILIPWQLFFLDQKNFTKQMSHIESERKYKMSPKLLSKRKGMGDVTSKRIIDRLIRQQNFINDSFDLPKNDFCGLLKGMTTRQAAIKIGSYFNIQKIRLWSPRTKGTALEYLIKQIGDKNINISRGVLTNKVLPNWQVVGSDIYRNTSGFVISDDKIPFIFLPSEINPGEIESRQIYTLIFLLIVIGLEEYDYFLKKNFTADLLKSKGSLGKIHHIVSEFLIPSEETEKLRNVLITEDIKNEYCEKLKVSPSALVTTLKIRGVVDEVKYQELLPEPYKPNLNNPIVGRSPRVSTSLRKFCGERSFEYINAGIKSGLLKSTQAQYLLFGSVNKKSYSTFRIEQSL